MIDEQSADSTTAATGNRPTWHLRAPRQLLAVGWLCAAAPLVFTLLASAAYTPDIPTSDDFDSILDTQLRLKDADGPLEFVRILVSQHNEHRIAIPRLLFLVDSALFGQTNFTRLAVFGNLFWAATVGVLLWFGKARWSLSVWELVPIPWILCIPTHRETMLWAMASVTNYGVILLSVLFIAALACGRHRIIQVLFPLALFSNGCGILLLPLGLGELYRQRQWRSLVLFSITAGLVLAAYFAGYRQPANHPPLSLGLRDIWKNVLFASGFLGCGIPAGRHAMFACGGVLTISLAYCIRRHRADTFLSLLAAFLGSSAVLAAVARGGFGEGAAINGRYVMFSLLSVVVVYVAVLRSFGCGVYRRGFVAFAATATMLVSGLQMRQDLGPNGNLESWTRARRVGLIALQSNQPHLLEYPLADRAAAILQRAKESGLYDFMSVRPERPARAVSRLDVREVKPRAGQLGMTDFGTLSGWIVLDGVQMKRATISVVLDVGNQRLLVLDSVRTTLPHPEVAKSRFQRETAERHCAFTVFTPEFQLPRRLLRTGVLVESGSVKQVCWMAPSTPSGSTSQAEFANSELDSAVR